MNVAIYWDIAPCSQYIDRRFGRAHHLHLQGLKIAEQEMCMLHLFLACLIIDPED
jgi:hypothetical protein